MAEQSATNAPIEGTEKQKKILTDLRERFDKAHDADEHNREEAMEDMKFVNIPGHQWEANMKKERGDRPCYEFNKLRISAKRVINNMRQNRAAGKVRPVEGGDKKGAEIREGLCRNILNRSDFDTVCDYAAEYQVAGGMGAWRVTTEYASDDVFEQDIWVRVIPNPFTLFSDPAAKMQMKEDARFWLLTERIPRTIYERKWKGKEVVDFPSHEFDDDEEWDSDEDVRICEYWYKEQAKRTLLQLVTGEVIDSESDEAQAIPDEAIKATREVTVDEIWMVIASGHAILEGPTKWPGKRFPFVQIYGDYHIIDGTVHWGGIAKHSKDPQRSYNLARTHIAEVIAQAPQAKWWVTPTQAEGNEATWKEAHIKNFPFLVYNNDPQVPGPPVRMGGAELPIALINESQIAAEEINMVTGIYQADVGAPNQASSGRQEIARQHQGALATYNFEDNQAKGIQATWNILLDLIPHIYDTERHLRILGEDGADDYIDINKFVPDPQTGKPIMINDMTHGKYDCTVTIGPNFSTKRQEATELLQGLGQSFPDIWTVAGDLIMKAMDLPYSDQLAERMQVLLPPQVQQIINGDNDMPPEVMAAMAQAEQAMAQAEEMMTAAQQEVSKSEVEKSEVNEVISKLEAEKARFEAQVAKERAELIKQAAELIKREAEMKLRAAEEDRTGIIDGAREQVASEAAEFHALLTQQVTQAVETIGALSAAFNAEATDIIDDIRKQRDERPQVTRIRAVRENGELVAVPEYGPVPGSAEGG